MDVIAENIEYKSADHAFRSRDVYAWSKYAMTSEWLRPHARQGMRLLNIGCGSGEYNAVAVKAFGVQVTACEPEEAAFSTAAASAPAGCEVRQCGLMELT